MNIFTFIIFTILLSLNIYARTNPFEATDTFKQIQKQYIESLQIEEINQQNIEEQEIKENLVSQEKTKQLQIQKEKLELIEIEKQNTLYYDILPFLNATIFDRTLTINIKPKFKLINQDLNHKSRKFIFDFEGTVKMYTKKEIFNHPDFYSITIGSHIEENFFRIVVLLNNDVISYEEDIDFNNSIIKIKQIIN